MFRKLFEALKIGLQVILFYLAMSSAVVWKAHNRWDPSRHSDSFFEFLYHETYVPWVLLIGAVIFFGAVIMWLYEEHYQRR